MQQRFAVGDSIWSPAIRVVWTLLVTLVVVHFGSGGARADLDPPSNPPILTTVDITSLQFTTDFDDGVNGEAEMIVVVTALWGGDHGTSMWTFTDSIDMDGAGPWPATPISQAGAMFHVECTPAAAPVIVILAIEEDDGPCWLLQVASTMGGAAVGTFGGLPGAVLGAAGGYLVAEGLAALDGNDALGAGDLSFTPTITPLTQAPQAACAGGFTAAPPPDDPPTAPFRVPPPPTEYVVGPTDDEFLSTVVPLLEDVAANAPTPVITGHYEGRAALGIDKSHEFSRTAAFAKSQFVALKDTLDTVDAQSLEPGGDITQTNAQIAINQDLAYDVTIGVAYIVAAQEWSEGSSRGAPLVVMNAATALMNQAATLADGGDARGAIDLYSSATASLILSMHPSFNRSIPSIAVPGLLGLMGVLLVVGVSLLLGRSHRS